MWSFDFNLYKKGSDELLASSVHNKFWGRSVSLEVDLDEGEYVVHVRLDRRQIRNKKYIQEGTPSWDSRKFSRMWSEEILAKSIVINFQPLYYGALLPIPPRIFTGKDLTELEMSSQKRPIPENKDETAEAVPPTSESEVLIVEPLTEMNLSLQNAALNTAEAASVADSLRPEDTEVKERTVGAPEPSEGGSVGPQALGLAPTASTPEPGPAQEVVAHERVCDICRVCPILGPRFICLESCCWDYDLCEKCFNAGSHPPEHRMIRINTLEEGVKADMGDQSDNDPIVLGLRVYSNKDAPAVVKGQLRHGQLIAWSKEVEQ